MPAIRDFATNFTTSTSGTTITIPMPAFAQNDLLLAVLVADTGTGVWSLSGWTELVRQTNTSQITILYKIAGASESDPTFTRTTAETFNGSVISIRDVDTTNPFGSSPVFTATNQAGASKYQLPTITTTVANSLVLYAVSNASAGVPSIIEGPVTVLYGIDGNSESSGVGWTFMPTTGTTPSDVTCSNVGTGAGVKVAVQIAAPSGGATVIPTYCAGDSSIYVNPIHGTTAYNGNAALAATADTLFGTTLNGTTVADATVAAAADYGLNPYHSTGRLTSITGSKNWAGAALDLSSGNNVDVSGKNVLVHTGPSTPGQIQRLSPVADFKGICFGMLSTSGNYKVWQVHGAGTSFGFDRDVPLIINSSNTSGLMQSTGTLNASAVDVFGFWTAGGGVSTTIWDFYSLWVLDTVIVVGGNSSEPINIAGLVSAASSGHERRSVTQQGDAQAVVYMPIQIGDGGTNPVYLDFNATAIEFPTQYNFASKVVNYCSVDNVAGIIYNAGASDTIKHRDSIISSRSRYFWGLHASSSASAAYDFSGLQVIGAGTITLNKAISIFELTISDYSTLDVSGATLNNCTIENVPVANDSLTTNASTNIDDCSINVSAVTAGNRWCSVADPSIFSGCAFTGGGGHAIRITTPGTYSFVGNTFAGFGADGSTGAAIYNDSGGAVTLNISGGGSTPTVRNGASASTTINNTVTLTITCVDESNLPIQNVQVGIFNSGNLTEYMNELTDSSGIATETFNFTSNTAVIIRARKSTSAPVYFPFETTGTITSSGFTLSIVLLTDNVII